MNVRVATFLAMLVGGAFSFALLPLESWQGSAKSLTTVLSICAAAVLVRLNRGLPAIDWSKVDAEMRGELVLKMRDLSVGYGITLAQIGVVLVGLLLAERAKFPIALGFDFYDVPVAVRQAGSALAGACITFIFARVAYVVWRDIDIVEFQSEVVTAAAFAEIKGRQQAKTGAIKKSSIRDPRKDA